MSDARALPKLMTDSSGPRSSSRSGFRVLELERGEMLSLVREALGSGAAVWVGVKGSSMVPAIPVNSSVRLRRSDGHPSVGDVVLAVAADGLPLLHRVIAIDGATVQTRGDRLLRADQPLPASSVIAVADVVATDGDPYPIPPAHWRTHWPRLRRVIRWIARLRRKFLDAV